MTHAASRALEIPPAIGEQLRALIRLRWTGKDPDRVIAALPESLPEGAVQRLAFGGPFGWCIHARLDRMDGRVALEALEDDRMSGPCHYRVWEDGTREEPPNEHTAYSVRTGAPPEEVERAREAYFGHNHAVQEQLRERGFFG